MTERTVINIDDVPLLKTATYVGFGRITPADCCDGEDA
jgi:hypothetical protein